MSFNGSCPACGKKNILLIPFDYICGCEKKLKLADYISDNTENMSSSTSDPDTAQGDQSNETKVFTKVMPRNVDENEQTVMGWLFQRTANKGELYYSIFEGDNFFGRSDDSANISVEIPIQNDDYVSRAHACIVATKDVNGNYSFQLKDSGERRPNGKQSTNGTYLNEGSNRLEKGTVYSLHHNDSIQVGETALIFKSAQKTSLKQAETEVLQQNNISTVIIRK